MVRTGRPTRRRLFGRERSLSRGSPHRNRSYSRGSPRRDNHYLRGSPRRENSYSRRGLRRNHHYSSGSFNRDRSRSPLKTSDERRWVHRTTSETSYLMSDRRWPGLRKDEKGFDLEMKQDLNMMEFQDFHNSGAVKKVSDNVYTTDHGDCVDIVEYEGPLEGRGERKPIFKTNEDRDEFLSKILSDKL